MFGRQWCLALAIVLPTAAAAVSPDTLCAASRVVDRHGAGGPLAQAAATAEAAYAGAPDPAQAGDAAMAMLGTAATGGGGSGEPALAAYCAAAGEAYRLGRGGNYYQARTLLAAAFRHAEAGGAPAIGALAAYRLALVATGGDATAGRGVRRSLAAAPAGGQPAARDPADCIGLTAPDAADDGSGPFAARALRCAVARARAGGDDALAARAGLKLARVWLAFARRTPAAREAAQATARQVALAAVAPARRVAAAGARAVLLDRLGETMLDAGGDGAALTGLPEAIRAAAGGDPALAAAADGFDGRLALAAGDPARAAALFRRAIFAEAQSPLPLRLADWHLLLGDADPEHRDEHLVEAFRALQAVRPLLPAIDPLTEESNFTLRVRPVFEALLDDRLRGARDDAAAIGAAQALAEDYRAAELQNIFGNDCVAPRPPVEPAALRPGEVLLYPVVLAGRVELIFATGGDGVEGGGPRYHRRTAAAGVTRDDIVAAVVAMTDATSAGDPDGWRVPARRLYAALIAPVADLLRPDGTLVVVPDGVLSGVPFAALTDGDGHFLIERTRIDVVPSLAYAQPGDARGRAALHVVAAALEKEEHFAFGDYAALAATGAEARFAAGMAPGTAAGGRHGTLIENFRRADLVRALSAGPVDVLHLATHANFNGRSDRSYIVADGELIAITDLRAMIERNRARGDALDLIILSACESAVGDDEASMGLAGAAVQAGAHSAIASLWQVNDAGTAALMQGFYTRYRAGAGKADALRGAQLALIAKGGTMADPNIWAAFTLLGSWR